MKTKTYKRGASPVALELRNAARNRKLLLAIRPISDGGAFNVACQVLAAKIIGAGFPRPA